MLEVELSSFSYSLRYFNVAQCLLLPDTVLQPKEFIVCQERQTAASTSGYEDLVKRLNNPRLPSLILFSEGWLNEYMQAQLTGLTKKKIMAKMFYHHNSCLRDITREHDNIDKEEVNLHKGCFNKLVQHVCHTLNIDNFQAESSLCKVYNWEKHWW